MKVYVLLRDGVPLGYCLAAATHCTLGRQRKTAAERAVASWLRGIC